MVVTVADDEALEAAVDEAVVDSGPSAFTISILGFNVTIAVAVASTVSTDGEAVVVTVVLPSEMDTDIEITVVVSEVGESSPPAGPDPPPAGPDPPSTFTTL